MGLLVVACTSATSPAPVTTPTPSATPDDSAPSTWTQTGDMITPRHGHTATLLRDGKVLVAGGMLANAVNPLASAELYDPASGSWTATGTMPEGSYGYTATLLADGRVLVTGDSSVVIDGPPSASAVLYDPGSGSWTTTGIMAAARIYHTATLLADGRVLAAGGGTGVASAQLDGPPKR